jgi:hypothetical protein
VERVDGFDSDDGNESDGCEPDAGEEMDGFEHGDQEKEVEP